MALVNLSQILRRASEEHFAVGNFDIFSIEMLKGVMAAAEETKSPIILAYGEAFEHYIDIAAFTAMMRSLAEAASVPVCIHLDHAVEFGYIARAIHCGFTSVMIDASDKPLEENIALTKKVVELAHALGVSVESEIGHVSGIEGLFENDDYIYTDVGEARHFVEATGVDALAVAIGTVHGVYKEEPRLNIARLKELHAALNVPLVLHGGSGLSDADFKACIASGVTKVNIHTDLTLAGLRAARISAGDPQMSLMKLGFAITDAVKADAKAKMELFGCCGKA